MDYSLLLGLHFRAPQYLKSYISGSQDTSSDGIVTAVDEVEPVVEMKSQAIHRVWYWLLMNLIKMGEYWVLIFEEVL